MVETERSQTQGSEAAEDVINRANDSAGSDASTATDQVDTENQRPVAFWRNGSDGEQNENSDTSPEEWEILQQRLAVQALKMGDFKALARITSQMALHTKNQRNVGQKVIVLMPSQDNIENEGENQKKSMEDRIKEPSSLSTLTHEGADNDINKLGDPLIGSIKNSPLSSLSGLQPGVRLQDETEESPSSVVPVEVLGNPTVHNDSEYVVSENDLHCKAKPEKYSRSHDTENGLEIPQPAPQREVGDTATVVVVAPLVRGQTPVAAAQNSYEAVQSKNDTFLENSTDLMRYEGVLQTTSVTDRGDESNDVVKTAQPTQSPQVADSQESPVSKVSPLQADCADEQIQQLINQGGEDQNGDRTSIAMNALLAASCEAAAVFLSPEEALFAPVDKLEIDDGMSLAVPDKASIEEGDESDGVSERSSHDMLGGDVISAIHSSFLLQPPELNNGGICFTKLLLKTLEEDAANSREQREHNSFSKELEVRDHEALMKWRSENYNAVSCCCLALHNGLRARCCSLLEWKWFDRIILLNITVNCIFMAIADPDTKNEKNSYNTMLSNAGIFFQSVFTFEAVVKIISRGFIFGQKAYLRDGWNVLDFCTVLLGLLEYIVVVLGASTSVLRTFRLLRPLRALRAVGRFKDLRMIVNLIISCLPLLVDVFALISFIFMVFGIIGVQLWSGYFRGRCYEIDSGLLDQTMIDVVCSSDNADGFVQCPPSETCLRIYMNPMYNSLTYDYIGSVLVILFQIMIQQGWTTLMYYSWDCYSFWSWPFFVFLNLVGPMFAVQLFLVVVANQYSGAKALQREAEKAAVELFEVKVGVVTANLPRQSRGGHSVSFDPYVQITVDEKMKKTRIIKNCAVPEWNEYYVFPVSSAASYAYIEVRNWKRQGDHEVIGTITLPVGVLDQSEEGTDRWYEICGAEGATMEGSIRIRTQWRMLATDEWCPLPEVDDEDMPEEEDAEDDDLSFMGWVHLYLKAFAESRFLNIVSILFICGNTLGMASDHSCDVAEDSTCKIFKAQLEEANLAFTSFFALEMIIKLWGLGVLAYFKDISNFFDFCVTVISLVEVPSSLLQIKCYTSSNSSAYALEECASAGGALSVLRSFRLVRILRLGKLLEFFPQIKRQLKVIRKTLGAVSSLVLLIIMYLIIFAILGMSILGGNATEYLRTQDPDNLNDFRPGNSVRVLVPGDPYGSSSFFISTATVVDFNGSKPSRQYSVYHDSDTNSYWPLAGMSNASIAIWQIEGVYWLDAEEVEPFQYEQVARRKEALIVALVPRGNFDSFFNAIISVFQVFTTSDLGDILYPSIRGTNMFAAVFFAIQILIGNLLLFNLFTGIIITGFSETKEEIQREENENQKMIEQDKLRRAASLARGASVSSKGGKQASVSRGLSIASSVGGDHCNSLESLFHRLKSKLFRSNRITAEDLQRSAVVPAAGNATQDPEEPPKTVAYRIVSNRYFEGSVMFAIAVSSVGLAIQRPGMSDMEHHVVQIIDTAVGFVFVTECILKIRGLGFFRYIGSRWNQLDFFLVITTALDLVIEWFASNTKISFFSTLKVIRALRPLRVISRMKRLKDTFSTITRSFIPVMNTVAIAMCIFFIFAIMAVQLLGGMLNYCTDPFTLNRDDCHGIVPSSNQTREWKARSIQYDWIGSAILSMFILASQDNWETDMFAGLDATSSTTGPYINNRPVMALFFLSYMVVGSFFVVQLFVGVFIDTFHTVVAERKAMSRQSSIASEATDASNTQSVREPTSQWRLLVYDVVTQKAFDIMIAGYIIINILLMACEAYKQSSIQAQIISQGNFVFTFVFGTELILKYFAFRTRNYFISGWNKFDFFVVSISYVGIALDLLGSVVPMNSSIVRIFRVFRIFRILRAFRIFRAAQRLQNLIRTLVRSLKEVANLGILLLLLFFVTAVMVVEIFGRLCVAGYDPTPVPGKFDRCILVEDTYLMDIHANFVNVGIALVTLFRICTGDNWSDILASCSLIAEPREFPNNATQMAMQYLIEYNRSQGTDMVLLSEARKALSVCQTSEELDAMDSIIYCEDKGFLGYCAPTCGDFNISSIIFTVFLFGSQFVLLNLVMAVLMRELSSAISSSARKQDNQTSASISVLLTVNQATNIWLRKVNNEKDQITMGEDANSGSEKHPA